MKNKIAIILSTVVLVTGCKMIPVKPTANFVVDISYEDAKAIVYDNAQRCWSREFSAFGGDAFVIERMKFSETSSMVTVRRSAPDIGHQSAFTIVAIHNVNGKSQIEINEGSCAYNCDMNFTPDVKRWLNGDNTCKKT